LPPELLTPFLAAFNGIVKDVVKRSAEAAVDTALEEVEARVEAVGRRVATARRNLGGKPKRDDREVVVVVEGVGKRKRRRRRRD